jgi:hypothetical protein
MTNLSLILGRFTSLASLPALVVIGTIAATSGCGNSTSSEDAGSAAGGTGSTGGAGGNSGGNTGTSTQTGALPAPFGSFTLNLIPPVVSDDPSLSTPGFTSFTGVIRNAEVPETIVWTKALEEAGCVLYVPKLPFCSACGSSQFCVGDEQCEDPPIPLNLGAVSVSGVTLRDGSSGFSVEPSAPKFNYMAPSAIAYPPAVAGTQVSLTGDGGDYPSISLTTTMVTPIELLGADPIPMNAGQSLPVRWTAAGVTSDTRIAILVNISHHGGARGKIECDVEDNGSLDIPAPLVSRLLQLGYSGFPTVEVSRRATSSEDLGGGTLRLDIASSGIRNLAIDGQTSCRSNDECRDGQTCLATTKQCG